MNKIMGKLWLVGISRRIISDIDIEVDSELQKLMPQPL